MTHEVSSRSLLKSTAAALAGSTVILTLFILPAEWGIDVTGVGSALGLTEMAKAVEDNDTPPEVSVVGPVVVGAQSKQNILKTTALRSDEMTLVLEPHTGAEIKTRMKKGDHFIFSWAADGGKIKFDMHGEPYGKDDEFTSYWKEKGLLSAQGSFTAPFEGTHGWYWRNRGDEAVTIKVSTTGFYEKLYLPK